MQASGERGVGVSLGLMRCSAVTAVEHDCYGGCELSATLPAPSCGGWGQNTAGGYSAPLQPSCTMHCDHQSSSLHEIVRLAQDMQVFDAFTASRLVRTGDRSCPALTEHFIIPSYPHPP